MQIVAIVARPFALCTVHLFLDGAMVFAKIATFAQEETDRQLVICLFEFRRLSHVIGFVSPFHTVSKIVSHRQLPRGHCGKPAGKHSTRRDFNGGQAIVRLLLLNA